MFPRRLRRVRRFLDDLVSAADVILAYEAPPRESAREVREMPDRHTARRPHVGPCRARRAGAPPAGAPVCVVKR